MRVFISHSHADAELAASLAGLLSSEGVESVRLSQVEVEGAAGAPAYSLVREADVLVGLLSTESVNVYYEIGVAIGSGVPVLVAAPAGESLPAGVATIPYVQLTGDRTFDARIIARRVRQFELRERRHKLKYHSTEAKLSRIAEDPEYLELVSSQEFEALIYDLLKKQGFSVEIRDSHLDPGYDFIIRPSTEGGLILVEAKKLKPQSRVSVKTVRKLMSAVSVLGAAGGLLVSGTPFTTAAAAAALGGTAPIFLKTVGEILKIKSPAELLESKKEGG
jgi:hypothetical protein